MAIRTSPGGQTLVLKLFRLASHATVPDAPNVWSARFNFRTTAGYVTDGAGQTYVLGTDTYPTTRNGLTFGWDTATNSANRSTGIDVRLAGINFDTGNRLFQVDLPAAGAYVIELAVGDVSGGGTGTQTTTVRDNVTDLFSLTPRTYNVANQFYDATDAALTDVTWPGAQVGVTKTFASTVARVACLDTGFWVLAHVSISASAGVVTFTGTGTIAFAGPAFSGTALETFTGTASETFSGPALAGTALETFTSTGAVAFSGPALAGTASETFTGTGTETFAGPALAGTSLETVTGTGAEAFAGPALAGAGSETITGTGATAIGVTALSGGALETFTGAAAVAFGGPALSGGEAQAITGTGAIAFAGPALAGLQQDVVFTGSGRYVYPPYRATPQAITGDGAIAFKRPALTGVGALAITGTGAVEFSGPTVQAQGAEELTGIGAIAASVELSGDGIVQNRRIVRMVAGRPDRALSGTGTAGFDAAVMAVGIVTVRIPDAVDRAWRDLQQAHAADEDELLLLGVFDS